MLPGQSLVTAEFGPVADILRGGLYRSDRVS